MDTNERDQDLTDALLEKAKQGDIPSFERLVRGYEKRLFNITYRMFGNTEDARDLSQETLIKVYKNLDRCVDIKHFKSWLYTIAGNACIDELRKRKGKTTLSTDASFAAEDGDFIVQQRAPGFTPEEGLIQKELAETLQKAILHLPPDKRRLIVLRDIQGCSYQELSEMTDTTMGTVKSKLARARRRLKEILTLGREQNE